MAFFKSRSLFNFKDTFLRYAEFVCWLLPDSLKSWKSLSTAILISGFLGVGFKILAFGLIIYYAKHLASGDSIFLLDYSFDPRTSIFLLGTSSVSVVVLLLFSSLCIYFSRRNIVRLSRKYEEYCSKRVFFLLSQKYNVFDPGGGMDVDTYLFRLVKSDARFAGRVLYMLLNLLVPGLTMLAASAVLLYLEVGLTLIIGLFTLGFIFCQYRINRAAAAHSTLFEKMSPMAGREYKDIIRHLKQHPQNADLRSTLEKTFASGTVKRELDAYEGRLQVVESSRLASGVFMALVLGLILLIMGSEIIMQGSGWGRLLVYLLALRFAMTYLQTAFSQITSINRFYPQVRRYFLFVKSFEDHKKSKKEDASREYKVVVKNSAREIPVKSQEKAVLHPGSLMALTTHLELNRYTQAYLISVLLGEGRQLKTALRTMHFTTSRQSRPTAGLGEFLGLEAGSKWADIEPLFPSRDLFLQAKELLPKNLDRELSLKIWDGLKPKLKFVLSMISALNAGALWLLVEARDLNSLQTKEVEFFLNRLQDRITVLVYNNNFEKIGSFSEQLVAVTTEERLLWLGTPQGFNSAGPGIEKITLPKKSIKKNGTDEDISSLLDL